MNRKEQMEVCIQEYRSNRRKEKSIYIMKHYKEVLFSFCEMVDMLIGQQTSLQESGKQDEIKTLCFLRLLSSGYTGSYEMAVGMSSKKLYLDKYMTYVYWKPEVLYKEIDKDIEELNKILQQYFVHIMEYELFYLKQKLLADDWSVFCGIIEPLIKGAENRIINSPLQLEKEIHVLCGDYMGRLKNVCRIYTEGGGMNG